MWVFIKGIPREMDARGLEKLIKRILKPAWSPFGMAGRIRILAAKILKIVHTRTRTVDHHGLIQISPASKTAFVIEKINQARLNGRHLEAHIYAKRYSKRDRRAMLLDDTPRKSTERRGLERRRKNLLSQVVDTAL
jgi:hypothetical protein